MFGGYSNESAVPVLEVYAKDGWEFFAVHLCRHETSMVAIRKLTY